MRFLKAARPQNGIKQRAFRQTPCTFGTQRLSAKVRRTLRLSVRVNNRSTVTPTDTNVPIKPNPLVRARVVRLKSGVRRRTNAVLPEPTKLTTTVPLKPRRRVSPPPTKRAP